MKNIHRAWLICASCTLLLFCAMGLVSSAFTVYQPYLISVVGLSNTQASTVVTVRNLVAMLATMSAGLYYRRISLRGGISLALLGTAAAFVVYGVSDSFWGFCLGSALAGVGYGYAGMIPVSLLIDRWFHQHQALALGICSAGSGMAILLSPLLTAVVEGLSLQTAFFSEAVFAALAAGVLFLLVRDSPAQVGLSPLGEEDAPKEAAHGPQALSGVPMTRAETLAMMAAIVLIGAIANPGFAHLSVLFREAGFSSSTVSVLLFFVGIVLMLAKCLYGQITDLMGAARSGWLFFSLLLVGNLVCWRLNGAIVPATLAALVCLGLGLPLASVALSVFARDLSSAKNHARVLRWFQTSYMLGALLFGTVPGYLADTTGSYRPTYLILSVCTVIAMLLVQGTYRNTTLRAAQSD